MSEPEFASIGELLSARVAEHADRDFLFSAADERRFTYGEFDDEVGRAAGRLAALGIARGGRVSLYLTNSVEYLFYYFACFRLGVWAGPVNAHLKAEEIAFIIGNSAATVVVTQPDLLPQVERARPLIASLCHVLVVGGQESEAGYREQVTGNREQEADGNSQEAEGGFELAKDKEQERQQPETNLQSVPVVTSSPLHLLTPSPQPPDPRPLTPDDVAVIIYTSGTTGKPKGVLLTHGNLLTNAREIAEWLGLSPSDRALLIMPLFHVNALMTTGLAALWAGASIVLAEKFSASRHWRLIADYGVTYFGSVATMLSLLNQTYPQGVPADCDVGSLRFALCGSAPVPVEVLKTYEALFACPVIEGYGLSESSCRSTFNPVDERRKPGSIGLPIGNQMRVVDEAGRDVGVYEVGEIVLRGANVMKGYYKNDEANAAAFRYGWFHTGDLGYQDEDGFFYIVDRKSDMIIRGGENIYPREIDEVLYRHPKVKDAATIGVADALFGEEVKSFVVLKEGEAASAEELIAYCREHLADFKCPKTLAILEDIPKGPTGKLLKTELRQRG